MKNYRTGVSADRSIAEIEKLLVKNGAADIWKEYSSEQVVALNFTIVTEYGKLPIRIEPNIEGVRQTLMEEQGRGDINLSRAKAASGERARDVAWRVEKDWLDAQLAKAKAEKLRIEKIFLADVYDMGKGKTLYQVLSEGKFRGLLMAGSGADTQRDGAGGK